MKVLVIEDAAVDAFKAMTMVLFEKTKRMSEKLEDALVDAFVKMWRDNEAVLVTQLVEKGVVSNGYKRLLDKSNMDLPIRFTQEGNVWKVTL